jgi:FMN phosphatase YigB (HAD superfamily)
MTLTLLFDLDDTLLETNLDAFIPAYFKALSGALADKVSPELMIPALMGGTKAMLANADPSLTLREVFDAYYFPKLGLDRPSLQAVIDRFYDEVFPSLAGLTKPIPEAIELVDWAFAQGHRVAVATNPIFPLKAIQHRLRWAGLPPEKYPFALVSSYETFHFTKEMVAYYPEVMAQLGWPEDPVVMVGDDVGREVKPTRTAGFPVYLISKDGKTVPGIDDIPQGPMSSFREWLKGVDLSKLHITFQTPQALLACLRSTPAALATLTARLKPPDWKHKPQPGEWCLTEVICHLRDMEREVNLPRLRKVLAEDNPFIPGEATDRWVEERHYALQDGGQALVDFTAARKEVISLLVNLQAEWSLPTRHAIFGPTSMQELIGFIVEHDRAHLQQVWKTVPGNSKG